MRFPSVLFAVWFAAAALAQPRFSMPHGLYDDDMLTVAIEAGEEGMEVRYTTDGSEPGSGSPRYQGPLTLAESTILRAVEVGEDGEPSPIATATYILTHSVLEQGNTPEGYPELWGRYTTISGQAKADYEMDPEMTGDKTLQKKIKQGLHQLPILSIATDKDNFFSHVNDPEKGGIYIYTGPPVGDPTGHGWTRPCCAELFGGPQQHDLTIDCGVKLHGGHGRLPEKNPKHSLRLVFKKEYGPGKLHYPLFGEGEPDEYDQLVVRCHFGNSWQHWMENNRQEAQYARDLWMRRMQRKMGWTSANAFYVHLFINGMYWGLYNLGERVDNLFGMQHLGGKKSDIDVVKIEEDGGNHLEATEGTLDAWNEMLTTAAQAKSEAKYQQLDTLLDIDNFIDYMLINQYAGNTDWDHHNWYAIRRRGADSQGFRFLCWDSEIIFEGLDVNLAAGSSKNGHPTAIFNNLLKNDNFARRYMARAKQLLADDGLLGETSVVEVWDSLYHTIDMALYDEAARWGDYRRDVHRYTTKGELYTVDNQFMKERKRLLTSYFPQRSLTVLRQIVNYLPRIAAGMDDIIADRGHDDKYYNLQGIPVEHPVKGVYIKNGKKVVLSP